MVGLSNGWRASELVQRNLKPYAKLILKFICRPLTVVRQCALFRSRLFRRMAFESARPNALLITEGHNEIFIVSSADEVVGKTTYITREPFDFHRMRAVLSALGNTPQSLLIDVGANIGTICIPAVKRALFHQAIAIEPEPRNYSLLLANIHINGLANKIAAHNFALGKYDDESLLLALCDDNSGDHRVRIPRQPRYHDEAQRTTIAVESRTIDSLIENIIPRETLLWMDVQGFEGYVLSGAKKTLSVHPPICLEFWPYGMTQAEGSYAHLKQALIEAGYNCLYDLDEPLFAKALTASALDDLYDKLAQRGAHTDLLFIRRS